MMTSDVLYEIKGRIGFLVAVSLFLATAALENVTQKTIAWPRNESNELIQSAAVVLAFEFFGVDARVSSPNKLEIMVSCF
jgi:hypothetical protein